MFWKQKMLLNKVSEGWDGMVISYQIEGSFEVFKKRKNNFGYIFPRVIIKSKLFVYSLNHGLNARTILYLHLFSEY